MSVRWAYPEADPVYEAGGATDLELAAAVAAVNAALALKQAAATAATDAELAAAVATLNAALTAKQDASSAATDAELAALDSAVDDAVADLQAAIDALPTGTEVTAEIAAAVAAHAAGDASDAELAAAVSSLNTAIAAKQDAATAATDAELASAVAALEALLDEKADSDDVAADIAAAVAAHAAGDATDAELSAAVASLTASIALKQDAATAATDTELADAVSDLEGLLAAHAAGDATDAELTAAVASLNASIAGKQDAATAATDAEVTAAVAAHRERVTFADLPAFHYVGHRTSQAIAPEGSMAGLEIVYASDPLFVLDIDASMTADGIPVVMHDTTVDRTTTGAGAVASLSLAQIKSMMINASSFTEVVSTLDNGGEMAPGPGWPDQPIPSVAEVLDRFGGKALITIEAKGDDTLANALCDLIIDRGLTNSVWINTNNIARATLIAGRGVKSQVWGFNSGSANIDAIEASGADTMIVQFGVASDAFIAEILASDIPRCTAYTVNRRYARAQLEALGIDGVLSDDAVYVAGDDSLVSSIADAVAAGVKGHGWRPYNHPFTLLKGVGLSFPAAAFQGVVLGDMSGDDVAADGTYTLTGSMVWDTLPSSGSNYAAVKVCAPSDKNWNPAANPALESGYACRIRKDGVINIQKEVAGSSTVTQLAFDNAGVTALVEDQAIPFTIQVTPTQIIFTRTDTGDTCTATDSDYRGGYIHFAKGAATGDVRLTALARS